MVPNRKEKQLNAAKTLLEIIKNPLILAVILAVPFSYFRWELPGVILTTVDYLAALSLPLALIGIGGLINFEEIRKASYPAILSTVFKLVLIPFVACLIAYELNFPAGDMGILFIFFGCPTAIVSFIMAEAMGSNGRLAGKYRINDNVRFGNYNYDRAVYFEAERFTLNILNIKSSSKIFSIP